MQIRASQLPKDKTRHGKPPHCRTRPPRQAAAHHHFSAPWAPLLLTWQSCFLPPQEPEQVGASSFPPPVTSLNLCLMEFATRASLPWGTQDASASLRGCLGGSCSCNQSEAARGTQLPVGSGCVGLPGSCLSLRGLCGSENPP